MSYQIRVMEPADRARDIRAATQGEDVDRLIYYYFRDEVVRLPVVRVKIGLPIYRTANFRTQWQQLRHIRKFGLSTTYFENGEEDEDVQQIQHDLLWELAQTGQGESIVPVSEVIKKGQTEPLLVTAGGVVVNGNRRLAAIRELGIAETVQVAVLPEHADEDDIIKIEYREQMQLETRLPYGWINDALGIRKTMERPGFDKAWIQKEMHLKSAGDVDDKVGALEAAETYLSERNEVDNWDLVAGEEQLFKDGYKAIKARKNEAEREVVRQVLHNIADKPRVLGSRAYEYIQPFRDNGPQLVSMLIDQFDLESTESVSVGEDEDLAVPADISGDRGTVLNALKTVLSNVDQGDANRASIKQVVDNFREQKNQKNAAEAALMHARKAFNELRLIDITSAAPDTWSAIGENLSLAIQLAQSLLTQIDGGKTDQ